MFRQARAVLLSGVILTSTIGLARADEAAPAAAPVDVTLEARAKAIEIQLIAPCCKNQTIDVHDSPVVQSMKREIRERLAAGDTAEDILRGFEERHGPSVRAVSSDTSANALGGVLAVVGAAGALGAVLTIRRWRRRGASSPHVVALVSGPHPGSTPAISDERLDREIEALDR